MQIQKELQVNKLTVLNKTESNFLKTLRETETERQRDRERQGERERERERERLP